MKPGGPPPRLHHATSPSSSRHPSPRSGSVLSLNVSAGGVPKHPIASAWVGVEGVEGDRQRNLKYHGGPLRAVCLFSAECVDALRAEGHPIAPGAIGENVTVAGLDWARVVPGVRLALGSALVLEVTAYTVPCRTIQRAFMDRRTSRVSQKLHSGWSRVYARVLEAGPLTVGDPVSLL